jgi:glucose/arabinose dehydrogenase
MTIVGRAAFTLLLAFLHARLCAAQIDGLRLPDGFVLDPILVEPLTGRPVGFTFLPDRRIILLEQEGTVRLAAADSPTSESILIVPDVDTLSERGLLGVAVDPAWPTSPFIYLYYTQIDSPARVVRYTAQGDLDDASSTGISLTAPYVVLEIPNTNHDHKGGTLRFGPDGMLYLGTGDDLSGCVAQEFDQPLGKMLRMDVSRLPVEGTGPPAPDLIVPQDNPLAGPTAVARLTYAVGFRNPFRFTIDSQTNDIFIGDVGERRWEEIDILRYHTDGGVNYGWPQFEGFEPLHPDSTCAETFPVRRDPIYVYPHPDPQEFSITAVIGGPLYRFVPCSERAFPIEYDGSYFFAEFFGGWIGRLSQGAAGEWSVAPSVPGQPAPTHWAQARWQIADLQFGPDGALYLMNAAIPSQSTPGLYRIRSTAERVQTIGDCAPLPVAVAYPNPAAAGHDVNVRVSRTASGQVSFRVLDLLGRDIYSAMQTVEGELVEFSWNGRDSRGRRQSAGVYVYRITQADGSTHTGKIVLVE